jgi:hypothetical protein
MKEKKKEGREGKVGTPSRGSSGRVSTVDAVYSIVARAGGRSKPPTARDPFRSEPRGSEVIRVRRLGYYPTHLSTFGHSQAAQQQS